MHSEPCAFLMLIGADDYYPSRSLGDAHYLKEISSHAATSMDTWTIG